MILLSNDPFHLTEAPEIRGKSQHASDKLANSAQHRGRKQSLQSCTRLVVFEDNFPSTTSCLFLFNDDQTSSGGFSVNYF